MVGKSFWTPPFAGSAGCAKSSIFKLHESITAELRSRPAMLGSALIGRLEAGFPELIRYYLARSNFRLSFARRSCNLISSGIKAGQKSIGGVKFIPKKLLLALAACLPIALSGCGGGGGASSSSDGEFDVTHAEYSPTYVVLGGEITRVPVPAGVEIPFDHSGWQSIRDDAIALTNGFRQFGLTEGVGGTLMARGSRPATVGPGYTNFIIAVGHYSAFSVERGHQSADVVFGEGFTGGRATAFGERSIQAPNFGPGPGIQAEIYRGPAVIVHPGGGLTAFRGNAYPASAEMIYSNAASTGRNDEVTLKIRTADGELYYSGGADVSNDGSFSSYRRPMLDYADPDEPPFRFHFKGDFYGSNWEETAGVFESCCGNSAAFGAWLAKQQDDPAVFNLN